MSSTVGGTTNTRALVEGLSYGATSLDRTPARDDAVLAAYKHLITHRRTSRLGLVANVYPLRDAGLDSETWYDDLVAPLLADLPGVTPPEPGAATWRYAPE